MDKFILEAQEKFIFQLEPNADVLLPSGKWLISPNDATNILYDLLTEARKKLRKEWLEEEIVRLQTIQNNLPKYPPNSEREELAQQQIIEIAVVEQISRLEAELSKLK